MRYAATKDPEAAKSAANFLAGMQRLHDITGVPGLYARSLCAPEDNVPPRSCAAGRATDYTGPCGFPAGSAKCPKYCSACGVQFRNSTASEFEGWVWKSDTSSDESAGHFFAFAIAAQLAPTLAERKAAAKTVADMATYMVEHGSNLQDWTGFPTTWGRWSPDYVNEWRAYSDERGLQSLQILAFYEAARNVTLITGGTPPAAWEAAREALLAEPSGGYEDNLNNLKIQAPCDDNYSDDELTFLPYYTILTCAEGTRASAAMRSMKQTWEKIKSGRSNLWAAIVMATTGSRDDADLSDMVWTLRNWPLDLIQWPMVNSHRLDIMYTGQKDREGRAVSATRVIPANERGQGRWNGSPFDVSDNGNPNSEMDPGAWLLPYWMARYHNLLDAP
jgi:hypothetical protein